MERVNILDTWIDNLSMQEFLERLDRGFVVTPNVDHLMKLPKDPDFQAAYAAADYRVCDSQILVYASRFLGHPLKDKISGSDLVPAFYQYHRQNREMRIFLLGAAEGVAQKALENINAKVGWEMVVAAYSPPFGFERREEECQKIIQLVNQSGATVLAMGVGSPKQEKWIAKYKDQMPGVKIFLAIGATIDFEAGVKPRSPKWMSVMGIEWVYRLLVEPKRLWRRYLLEDTPFVWLVLKQKFSQKKR